MYQWFLKERKIKMAIATKEKTVLDFLNNTTHSEYNIDFRENSVTLSYDFIIDTGATKILIKIGQKLWDSSDAISIVDYLQTKEQKIHKALLADESVILSMK